MMHAIEKRKRSAQWLRPLACVAILGCALAAPHRASAATLTVTKTADTADGACTSDCSLREALIAANAAATPTTIALPAGTYRLTIAGRSEDASATGDLDSTAAVTIVGAGAETTIIDAAGIDRALHVVGGSLTLRGLAVRGGDAQTGDGGGVLAALSTALTLDHVLVSQNSARRGGGVSSNGDSTVLSSTIANNSASETGGGLRFASIDPDTKIVSATVDRSTIAGNRSGTFASGALFNAAVGRITASTIANNLVNTAGTAPDSAAVVISTRSPQRVELYATVFAGSRTPAGAIQPDCSGDFTSTGFNVVETIGPCAMLGVGVGNRIGVAPLLGPLQQNGGGLPTLMPQRGSPLIDAPPEPGLTCGAADARGLASPVDSDGDGVAFCDIGAVEVQPANLSLTGALTPTPVGFGATLYVQAAVRNAGPLAAELISVTVDLPDGVGFLTASGAGWLCAAAAQRISCTRARIDAQSDAPPVLITATAPPAPTTLSVQVRVVSRSALELDAADNAISLTGSVGSLQVPRVFFPSVGS